MLHGAVHHATPCWLSGGHVPGALLHNGFAGSSFLNIGASKRSTFASFASLNLSWFSTMNDNNTGKSGSTGLFGIVSMLLIAKISLWPLTLSMVFIVTILPPKMS